MAPVDMPAQTYQWNKRVMTEEPAPPVPPSGPTVVPDPPPVVVAPVVAPVASQPTPVPAAGSFAAGIQQPSYVPPAPVTAGLADEPPTVWGIGAACVVALGLPAGAFALMHLVSVPGIGGTNWGLLIGTVALAFTVAGLVGHLASERRCVGGTVRAVIAAGLSLASSAVVLQLIDSHPRKFGFELSFPMMLPALLPAAFAAFVAYRPIAADF